MKNILLSNGVKMPMLAIGTNWMNYNELRTVVKKGLLVGFRAIDTARDYGNEPVVGKVIKSVLSELKMKRSEIFITTKIGNSQQNEGNIEKELEISLKNLQTDYIDLWLMHWPYPNYFMYTWKKMEYLYNTSNKIRSIGVSNFQIRHFNELFSSEISLKPMVNQIEYHPLRTVPDLISFMDKNDIRVQAYAPLCRLIPPLKNAPILNVLQDKYKKTIGQIILRWHVQQGFVMPVFKTYNPNRFEENMDIFDFSLTSDEMNEIFSLNMDYKYHLESVNCPGY